MEVPVNPDAQNGEGVASGAEPGCMSLKHTAWLSLTVLPTKARAVGSAPAARQWHTTEAGAFTVHNNNVLIVLSEP